MLYRNGFRSRGRSRLLFLLLRVIVALVLAGCVEARTAATQSWSGVAPSPDQEAVYVGTHGGRLIALDATTGTPRAQPFEAPQMEGGGHPAFYGTPTIANGLVYAGGYQGTVFALREGSLDGVREFQVDGNRLTKGVAGAIVPTGDQVVVGAAEGADAGRIYVLDGETLTETCRYPERGSPPIGQIWSTPLVVDGVIYVGSMDHRFHAVRVEDCSAVWPEPADLRGAVVAPPFSLDGKIYVGTFDRRFYEVNKATGNAVELFRADNWFWGGAASDGRLLFVPNLDGRLYAYDVEAGRIAWTYTPRDAHRTPMIATPAVHGNTVIVGSDAGTIAILRTRDGGLEWDLQMRGGEVRAPLTVSNGLLYVQTTGGVASAVDLEAKRIVWEQTLDEVR